MSQYSFIPGRIRTPSGMTRKVLAFCVMLTLMPGYACADDLLDRPLFKPDRRASQNSSSVTPAEEMILTGIVSSRNWLQAVFQIPGTKTSKAIGTGGMIEGWKVTSITPAAVNLERGSEKIRLTPRFRAPKPQPQ